jgi:hypothetical protein
VGDLEGRGKREEGRGKREEAGFGLSFLFWGIERFLTTYIL